MTFLALHRGPRTSLATDGLYLAPDELSACQSAAALLQRLEHVLAGREAELQAARAQARAEGHAAGREAALLQTAPQLAAAWQQAAAQAQTEAGALRGAVIELSLQVVQRVCHELAAPEVVAALVQRASEHLLPEQNAVVRVHPDTAHAVRARLDATPGLELRADPSLAPLDCVFDTPTGQLLAGLSTQLAHVGAALHAAAAQPEEAAA